MFRLLAIKKRLSSECSEYAFVSFI
jgi:hypothetical protein